MSSRKSLALFAALVLCAFARPTAAQEPPARRVANIVSVAVEEYGKAVDAQGRLISAQEYQETNDFLVDAKRAAERLSGSSAAPAQSLLDSIVVAVKARRPISDVRALERRFATVLGNEARLELPTSALDVAEGKAIYAQRCASCHGESGLGDGPAGRGLNPAPPAVGTAELMHGQSPGLTYRVVSVGIAGTPMAGYAGTLTPQQRWNVVSYITSLRSTEAQRLEGEGLYTQRCASCHGATGAGDGAMARSLSRLPPDIGTVAWQSEHSDDHLAEVVRAGIPGTAMPPSNELSPEQALSVVAYLRTLPTKDRANGVYASASDGAQDVARTIVALLEQSLSAAKSGRPSDAADRATDAYMAFEPIESPARAKNPGLVSSMERIFTDFKGAVRANDVRAAERLRDAIEAGLPDVVALTAPAGSGWEAFWQSFLIILREGLEAILVVGAVVAFLIKTGHRDRLISIWWGVAWAILASAVTALVLKTLLAAAPASREIIEGLTLLVAVAVLFSVSYWLISKVEAAKWQAFIREKVNDALQHGGGRALAFVAFLAVYREGAETALFYQALFNEGPNVAFPLSMGIVAGFAALAVIFTLFYRFGVRIPLRPFFSVTSVLLYLMAFVFMGKGIRELQEGNAIPLTAIPGFPHSELLGLYPSWQGVLAQLALLILFAFAVLKTFWPKRSVALPTVMAAAPAPDALAAIRAENEELRRRLAALEEAVSRETARG
ncbi:MAG TPA: cytochrome c/FTR1 family iron permease [Gemmatimonadaceae bacterium]|jgi:high-affinity iron transporter|nr:cytochrome c/FTR1 family iron permease [Gemmatimonadaceae bacterium]